MPTRDTLTSKEAQLERLKLARKARRQRFWREHKQNVIMASIVIAVIFLFALFNPWVPEYLYNELSIQEVEPNGNIFPRSFEKLYQLGTFYRYTLRGGNALKCYDEIGYCYFGFKISDFAKDPALATEVRRQRVIALRKGLGNGPPYKAFGIDLKYVPLAIYYAGNIVGKKSLQAKYNVFKYLYIEGVMKDIPNSCDPEITEKIMEFVNRYAG